MPMWLSVCRSGAATGGKIAKASDIGPIGEISLSIRSERGDDLITVLLHQAQGSLSLLEVVWYNFPDPIPNEWIEVSRDVAAR